MKKLCKKCGQDKEKDEYPKTGGKLCSICLKIYMRDYMRSKRPIKIKLKVKVQLKD